MVPGVIATPIGAVSADVGGAAQVPASAPTQVTWVEAESKVRRLACLSAPTAMTAIRVVAS